MTMVRTILVAGVLAASASAWVGWGRTWPSAATATAAASGEAAPGSRPRSAVSVVAALGRVEPVSEELEVAAEVSGRIAALLVDEGDEVATGQVVARLESTEYEARVASAQAAVAVAAAEQRRLVNGARDEERREAQAATAQADAALAQAVREHARRVRAQSAISREELDRAASDVEVARARQQQASEHARLVNAPARSDDLARAEAALQQARARLLEAGALLAKTVVRSPLTGTVLRVRQRPGERVSVERPDGGHLLTIADLSVLRVRADVDERDVAHVRRGQRVWVTADAYGDRRFTGRVVRVGEILGGKNFRSETPTERVDTRVLETLVELDPGMRLPIGLRVDTFIERDTGGDTRSRP